MTDYEPTTENDDSTDYLIESTPFAHRYAKTLAAMSLEQLERHRLDLERFQGRTPLQEVRRTVALQCVIEAISKARGEMMADMAQAIKTALGDP